MKFSRRNFIHAACTVAAVTLIPNKSDAWIHGQALQTFTPTQRTIINMNLTAGERYPFILMNTSKRCRPKLNGFSPYDGLTLNPFPQQIDQNGYPNVIGATAGGGVIGQATYPASANSTGPYIHQSDGDGQIAYTNLSGETFTELNLVTPGTATFTSGTANIAFSNAFDPTTVAANGQQVIFLSTVGNITARNLYWVIPTGLSTTNIQVSATRGGSAVVPNANGSATVNGTYTRGGNGNWTNVPGQTAYVVCTATGVAAGELTYQITNTDSAASISSIVWAAGLVTVTMSAAHNRPNGAQLYLTLLGTSNSALNGTFFCTITGTTTFTFALAGSGSATGGTMCAFITNIRPYRQADESRLLAGNNFRLAWLQSLVDLNPGYLRFMNWNNSNGGSVLSFTDRNVPSYANWASADNLGVKWNTGPAYGRTSGYQDWTLAAITTGTVSNPNTTPGTPDHGQAFSFQVGANGSMGGGPQITISSITTGVTTTINTSGAHGRFTGDKVWFTMPAGGMTQLGSAPNQGNRGGVTITVTSSTQFTVAIDSTVFSAFTTGYFTMLCGSTTIVSIQQAATPVVTTTTNHNLTTGDKIIHRMTTGMVLLNLFPVIVTVTGATTFTISVNTSGYPAFTSGTVVNFCTMNVGGQGAFPLALNTGVPVASGSNNRMTPGLWKAAVFDKTISLQSDGAGNLIPGVWSTSDNNSQIPTGVITDTPIEVCVACVNEINTLAASQGITNLTHMYVCTPAGGISSFSPGETPNAISAKNYGVGMVDVCKNPSSTKRAAGWSALPSNVHLQIEWTNEPWNFAGPVSAYIRQQAIFRWPTIDPNDFANIQMLLATGQGVDIGAAFPALTNPGAGNTVHRAMGCSAINGSGVGSLVYQIWNTGANTTFYNTDATVTGNAWGVPKAYHQFYNVAPYVDNPGTYYAASASGTRTYNDDLALYAGTDNTGHGGGNYTGAANPTLAISNFVNSLTSSVVSAGPPLGYWQSTFYPDVVGWMDAGKYLGGYEGGANWKTLAGQLANGQQVITASGQAFLLAISNSSQWATAENNFYNAIAAMPHTGASSLYVIGDTTVGDQWTAMCTPDTWASGIEGQALKNNANWVQTGVRNQALSF
jgi:hypothetical protein